MFILSFYQNIVCKNIVCDVGLKRKKGAMQFYIIINFMYHKVQIK